MNVHPKQNELVTPRGATEKPGKESRCKKYATRTGERLIPNESHSRLASANKKPKVPTNVPPTESQPRKTLLNGKRDTGPPKSGTSLKLKE